MDRTESRLGQDQGRGFIAGRGTRLHRDRGFGGFGNLEKKMPQALAHGL